ncbi:MAG: ABC transporter permease [Candidatus Jordarchaeaceae archaeon]
MLNKVRSFLTTLGIVIGVGAVIILTSLVGGLEKQIRETFESLGANSLFVFPGTVGEQGGGPTGAPVNKLTYDMVNDIRKIPGVKDLSPHVNLVGNAVYGNKEVKNVDINAVDYNFNQIYSLNIVEGRFFSRGEVAGNKMVVVIGPTVKRKLFSDQSPIGKQIRLKDKTFTVVGVTEEKGSSFGRDLDNSAYFPYTVARSRFGAERPTYILIKTIDTQNVNKVKKEIEKALSRKIPKDDFSVRSQEEGLKFFQNILNVLAGALGGIAGVSLLVGGVGIMNIMFVSVTERTREIGLRKAVGASFKDILTQFLLEAVILSLVGGVIGVIFGIGISSAMSKFIDTSINYFFVLLSFGVSALIGVIFGVAPAIKAARLDPIVALRYE